MSESGKVRRNSAWMITEQIARQALGLLVAVWVARHLGPSSMGALSYSLSLTALLGIVTTAGLNRIAVREFSVAPDVESERRLLITSLAMRFSASIVMVVVAILCSLAISPEDVWIVAILSLGYFFTAFDLVDLLYQSKLRSKDVARVRLSAFLASCVLKCSLLYAGAGLTLIAIAYLMDWVLVGCALAWLYFRDQSLFPLPGALLSTAKRLFRESHVEVVAGFSGLAFMRIDQVMLQYFREPAEVAVMAVSSKLTEAWYFVPAALVSSAFPAIVRMSQADPGSGRTAIRRLYRQLSAMTILAALFVTVFSGEIVHILYGSAYQSAADVLVVQIWCTLFMAYGIASGSWLIASRQGILNLQRNLIGAVVNIGMNLYLIPRYGALGAAWSTLAAFSVAYLLSDFLDPRTRQMGLDKLRAIAWL